MTRVVLLALATVVAAAGCAAPDRLLLEARSARQATRIDAAIALAEGTDEQAPDFLARKEEIAAALRSLLEDRSALVRQVAVDSLFDVQGEAAAGAITDRLRDRDPWVRYAAAKRLGRLRAKTAAEALAERLRKDESVHVRRAAARALGAIGARSALRDLYLALGDTADVRLQAYLALKEITGEDHGEDPRAWRAAIGAEGR